MYLYPQALHGAWHGYGEPQPAQQAQQARAKQIYAASGIREITDRHFQNIFYDRGKLIVVSFWADSCRPCDAVASSVVSVAQQIARGPHAKHVKFYHAQWDPAVNPRLHQRYGFKKIPVVYFYYMCTGKQPSKEAPLLEGATRGDRFDTDPAAHMHKIETILRRHGHIPPARKVARLRGWGGSRDLLTSGDLKHIDQILLEPSRARQYFDDAYCANSKLRLSLKARIVDRAQFNLIYQRMHGHLPGADTLGVVDPTTLQVYMVSINQHMQVYLNSAVHEAVHLYTCRQRPGMAALFYAQYGSGLTEGFTQLVTEDIFTNQGITLSSPRPYETERQMAEKLVSKLGFSKVADDYFRCAQNVYNALHAANLFNQYYTLRRAAENATSEAERKAKYREIIRLLDGLP